MSQSGEVTVYTIPSTFLTADQAMFGYPPPEFRRVVGVESADGRIALAKNIGRAIRVEWNNETSDFDFIEYEEEGTQEHVVQREVLHLGTPQTAEQFIDYCTDVVFQNDTTLRHTSQRPEANYSCGTAAIAIAGDGQRLPADALLPIAHDLHKSRIPFLGFLAAGQMGFVTEHLGRKALPLHMVIGLGRHVDACVSVMNLGGPVGIASYGDTLAFYQGHYPTLAVQPKSPIVQALARFARPLLDLLETSRA